MSTRKIIALVLALVLIVPAVYYLWTEQQLPGNTKIDHLLVLKSKRELQVYSRGKLTKVFMVAAIGVFIVNGIDAFRGFVVALILFIANWAAT